MLESLVAWVLNTYIGEYLENLNTDQLSVALLQGQVELEQVPLKKTALRKFDIPLSVKAGVLGKLRLSVPLTALRSEAWKVSISDLYVLLEPSDNKYDVEFDEEYQKTKKSQQLDALEAFHKKTGYIDRRDGENLFKLLDLNGVSIYWDNNIQIKDTPETLRELITSLGGTDTTGHSYVLSPVTAEIRMERNTSKFPLKTRPPIPRFKFDLEPENLHLEMSKRQLLEMRVLGREWARYERARKHRKWRPKQPVKDHGGLWWVFAIQCQLEWIRKQRERESWQYAVNRAKTINAYCRAYRKKLEWIANTDSPLKKSGEEGASALMRQVEGNPEYSYEDLHILRDTVFRKLMKGLQDSSHSAEDAAEEDFTTLESEQFETPDEGMSVSSFATLDSELHSPSDPLPPSSSGGGLYGWISSWFSAQRPEENKAESKEDTEWTEGSVGGGGAWWGEGRAMLPQYLRDAEKQLEEGILDVLNESWDDSTLLRRDTLLARIQLRIRSLTLGFVDDESTCSTASDTKVLAGQLTDVFLGIKLSPRHFTTSMEVVVGDLSVHSELLKSGASDQSLLWSSGMTAVFALGKAASPTLHAAPPIPAPFTPLLRCFYERKVAKFVAKHTLNMEFSPISIMYQAAAFEMLCQFFEGTIPTAVSKDDQDLLSDEDEVIAVPLPTTITPDIYMTQVSASVKIPRLSIELRSELSLDPGEAASGQGKAFACAHFNRLWLGAKKIESYRTELDIQIGGLELEDLVEGDLTPHLQYLIRSSDVTSNAILGTLSSHLSSSCPDLVGDYEEDMEIISGSLPKAYTLSPLSPPVHLSSEGPRRKLTRRGSMEKVDAGANSTLRISIIHPEHPKFNTLYKGMSLRVDGEFGSVDINVNPQTWVLLFDFLGLIGPPPPPISREDMIETSSSPVPELGKKEVRLKCKKLKLVMNKPQEGTQLGNIFLSDSNILIETCYKSVLVSGSACGIAVVDEDPTYSRLYPEKLFMPKTESFASLKLLKHSQPDPHLVRPHDILVEVQVPTVVYVHTHRFFTNLLNYWLHFIDLIDFLSKMKAAFAGQALDEDPGHGTRVMLKVDVEQNGVLILPVNSLASELLVGEIKSLQIGNNFLFASQTVSGAEQLLRSQSVSGYDDDAYDCLLDVMHVDCTDLNLYSGTLAHNNKDGMDSQKVPKGYELMELSSSFCVVKEKECILAKPYKLSVVIERNLDASISRNVPDLAIFTHIVEERARVTLDVYKRVRGFLETNLGDQLPAPPKAPMFRQDPKYVTVLSGRVWTGLSFQLEMTRVELDCLNPSSLTASGWESLGEIDFSLAQLSFETLSDQSSELDLIIHSGALIDTRFEDVAANKRQNVFPCILSSGRKRKAGGDLETERMTSLMAEVHFMSGKNMSPKLTLLLSHIQLMGVADWLNLAKDFLMDQSDYQKELEQQEVAYSPRVTAIANPFTPGVLQKIPIPFKGLEGLAVKVNLQDCDVLLLEDTSMKNSLAFVIHVSGVFYLTDKGEGQAAVRLDANSLQLSTCLPSKMNETLSQLTDPFSGTVEVVGDKNLWDTMAKVNQPGLLGVNQPDRRLEVSLSEIVVRLAYRDYLVCEAVLKGLLSAFSPSSVEPIPSTPRGQVKSGIATKLLVKLTSASVWLLDDFQDSLFPLVRFGIREATLEQNLKSSTPEGTGNLVVFADYFNQKVYGWEPLVEPWDMELFTWMIYPGQNALHLNFFSQNSILDMNLTQTLIQQVAQFYKRWPDVKQSLAHDFRAGCGRHRTDHLPYLLKNETGTALSFAPYLSSDSGKKRKWLRSAIASAVSFAFPNKHHSLRGRDAGYSPHQLIVKVDGFQEISPVSVDSVGTFFRSARFVNEVSSSLSCSASYARVVVEVSTDQDGRKLVTVRSSLTLVNGLFDSLQIKLENMTTFVNDTKVISLAPGEVRHAPLNYAISTIHARPTRDRWSLQYARPLHWETVTSKGKFINETRTCSSEGDNAPEYKMCVRILREHYPESELPGHTVTFYPPLTLLNLLPLDLGVQLSKIHRRVPPGHRTAFTSIENLNEFKVKFLLETFTMLDSVVIKPTSEETIHEVEVYDDNSRPLVIKYTVIVGRGGAVQMSVGVDFWIVNMTPLALVVKQEGKTEPASGQFEEHEKARSKLPLVFSFSDKDCPEQCSIRLGSDAEPGYQPVWSKKFVLTGGIADRKLTLKPKLKQLKQDKVYNVGIEVRAGQGLYKNTKVVMLTPLLRLDNRSRHQLKVAQQESSQQEMERNSLSVRPNCFVPWHWPRQEAPHLLGVRRENIPHWSAGIPLNKLSSFHLNIRNASGEPTFLRVEIVLHGGMYYVTFSDAETLPPPIRLENMSLVPVMYHQIGTPPQLKTILPPQTKVDYNWDDMVIVEKRLELVVFDGRSTVYDLSELGGREPLIYDNNFFIQLKFTFTEFSKKSTADERNLVLEARSDGKIFLNHKDKTKQQQLWRMNSGGQLVNVGISRLDEQDLPDVVLDVQDTPDPHVYVPLVMRRQNELRNLTQKWSFTPDSRLVCAVGDMYVQAAERCMKAENSVVLGPVTQCTCGVPDEQWIEKEREKAGSGRIGITVTHKGPTRILNITDLGVETKRQKHMADERANKDQRGRYATPPPRTSGLNLELTVNLNNGLGLSLINSALEELLYCKLSTVSLSCRRKNGEYSLAGYVFQIQADNQLWQCERWPVLYIKKKFLNQEQNEEETYSAIPALSYEIQWSPLPTYDSFECFRLTMNKVWLQLEEILLWKLVEYFNLSASRSPTWPSASTPTTPQASIPNLPITQGRRFIKLEEPNIDLVRPDPMKARRCYFGCLQLECPRLYLSVLAVPFSTLPHNLRLLKEQWNVNLVRFENAPVQLRQFHQLYYFETLDFLLDALQKHYSKELKGAAVRILGTVDFLGNPIGLFQDLESGFKELLIEGSVSGFVSGVGHGFSNSIAKLSSSLSEGVGQLTRDTVHSRNRDYIRQHQYQTGGSAVSHIFSGVKGLGLGLLGGATSIITQPAEGLRKEGVEGLVYGLAKGAANTFTRPVQGVFDLTTGVATAAKEALSANATAQTSRFPHSRLRCPRVTQSLSSTIPPYDPLLSEAQMLLMSLSARSGSEICLSVHVLLSDVARSRYVLQGLVCTDRVYIIKTLKEESCISLVQDYAHIECCSSAQILEHGTQIPILKIHLRSKTKGEAEGKGSRIKCSSMELAETMCKEILYAKQQYDDRKRRLPVAEDFNPDPVPTYAQTLLSS